jgi:hypothetical protein
LVGPLDVVGVHWVFLSANGYQETYTAFVIRYLQGGDVLKAPRRWLAQ